MLQFVGIILLVIGGIGFAWVRSTEMPRFRPRTTAKGLLIATMIIGAILVAFGIGSGDFGYAHNFYQE